MFSLWQYFLFGAFCVGGSILYACALAIYNVFFHPFRNIPGPRLYAISRLFWIRDWLSGNLHNTVRAMHNQYGEIIRVAPDEISFINPDAWSEIYSQKTAKSMARDPKWYAALTEGQQDIIVGNHDNHARYRKLFSPAFSDKALRENEAVITENIDLLISRLKGEVKKNNGIADMVKWYNWTAFDVIGSLVYGESFGCLENAEYHPWLAIVLQNIKASSYVALMERYNLFKKLIMAIIPKSLMEKRNMHIGIIRDKCARRIERRSKNEKGSNPRDMISYIPDDGSMTQGEIEANLALITMAGSETSATCLAACSYFLTKNMDAARKLREEIRGAFKSEADMSYENIKPLPYLMAVMKEALRLYPPTPVGLPRRVISNGEVVCGHFIPRDTVVYITQYSAYRSPTNFASPDSFIPERWLNDARFTSDKKDVMQPFITGPYSCIGKSLAYMEIALVLARMVYHFDWELEVDNTKFEEEQVYALWQKSPLNLRLVQRN